MSVRDDEFDARESEQLDDTDAGESPPPSMSGDESGSSPSDNTRSRPRLSKEERDRRAAEGRRNATISKLESQVSNLTTQLGNMASQMSADDRRRQQEDSQRMENYLRTLPPEQRAIKEVEMLKGQVAALRAQPMAPPSRTSAPPPAPPAGGENPEAYQRRRMGEILDEVEDEYGIRLTGREAALNNHRALANESSFVAAVHTLAQTLAENGDTVATSNRGASSQDEERTTERSRDLVEQVSEKVARDFGFNRPNSPRASAPARRGAVTSEHFQSVMEGYDSKRGPRQVIKELRALRERAENQVAPPRRGAAR